MAKEFTLGKSERLKSRKAIDQLFKNGKRFTIHPFRIFYNLSAEDGLQMGVGASTRNFKKAVDRNKIKRLTREAWRIQKNILKEKLQPAQKGLHIFFIYTEKQIPEYKQVFESVTMVLQKLEKVIEK